MSRASRPSRAGCQRARRPPRSLPGRDSPAAKGGSDMAAMTTQPVRPPVLPPPSGRAGFGGTLRSEFTKIRSVRSTYWTLLVLLAVSIGIGAAISAGTAANWSHTSPSDRATFDATQASIAGLFFLGQLVIVVLGAIVLTAEYSTGMIRTALYVTLCGLFAFAAGAIMRHTAAAITSVIGLLFVIPILAHLLPNSWYQDLARWLPDAAGRAISATIGGQDSHLFSPWSQFAVFAVYTVILLAVGGVLFRKRDA